MSSLSVSRACLDGLHGLTHCSDAILVGAVLIMTGQQGHGGRVGGRWGRLSRGVQGPMDLDENNSRQASAPPSRTARPDEPRGKRDDQVDEAWLQEQAQVWGPSHWRG